MSIITAQKARDFLGHKDLVIIDARGGNDAYERYTTRHIQNALFVDLEKDLSHKNENAAHGGRHPLPEPAYFSDVLSRLGIQKSSQVIVYDDKNGANAAARFWWMMRACGHEKVFVVSGGIHAMMQVGFVGSSGDPTSRERSHYPIEKWHLPMAFIQEVEEAVEHPEKLIIDVRENYRYRGESEPIDTIAGHIPGAINIPYTSNLSANGNFLDAEALMLKYKQVVGNRDASNVIVHCGSGVTACHTLLAFHAAGLSIPKLYVGSWSEWSRNNKPVMVES